MYFSLLFLTASLPRSVSQVNLNTDSIGSVTSSSSGFSSALGGSTVRSGVNWTPAHSLAGSTPTHTEGTPSLTESSESEIGELLSSSVNHVSITLTFYPLKL